MLSIALPAHAQWKWKDASGKIQYSDLPPPSGTPEANILQRPAGQQLGVMVLRDGKPVNVPAAEAAKASAPSKADLDAQAKQKQDQADQLARQKADQARVAQQKRDNCAAARENLATLQSGVRLRTGTDGAIMDDAQRNAAVDRAQQIINSDCN
jgi:hypothetical protein